MLILPNPPFDCKKAAKEMISQLTGELDNYAVAITNVDESYLHWKNDEYGRTIMAYMNLGNEAIAFEMRKEIASYNIIPLNGRNNYLK